MTNKPQTAAAETLEGLDKTSGSSWGVMADITYGLFFVLGWLGIFFFTLTPQGI